MEAFPTGRKRKYTPKFNIDNENPPLFARNYPSQTSDFGIQTIEHILI